MYLRLTFAFVFRQRNKESFRWQKIPTTKIIVDGTEIPIDKPTAPQAQQATFKLPSSIGTLQKFVEVSPGGMVSYVVSTWWLNK